ncbi:MAG: hypothetical protein WAZ78_04450 [Candidatus Moraniibacteriota bacterium]
MLAKVPKNTGKYYWTEHVKFKMRFYGLSEQKILGVISNPKRKEEGIVEKTVAVMKPVSPKVVNGKEIWKQEVWVMYQTRKAGNFNPPAGGLISNDKQNSNSKYKIISAWRYPGVSPQNNPIPQEILRELSEKF